MIDRHAETLRVPVNFNSLQDSIVLNVAGDFHIGSKSFNQGAFNTFITHNLKEAEKSKVYLLLMGDIFDSISPSDRRRYAAERQILNQDKSQELAKELLTPIINNKKITIIGSLSGNHELKYSQGDTDPITRLYENTGIESLGSKRYIYLDLKLKNKYMYSIRMVAYHGCKSPRLESSRTRLLREFQKDNELTKDGTVKLNHLFFYGHTHGTLVDVFERIIPDMNTGKSVMIRQWCCLTGSFMDSLIKPNYASDKNLPTLPVGYINVRIKLKKDPIVSTVTSGLNPNAPLISIDEF